MVWGFGLIILVLMIMAAKVSWDNDEYIEYIKEDKKEEDEQD